MGCKNGGWRETEARFLVCSRGVAYVPWGVAEDLVPGILYRNIPPLPRLGGMPIDAGARIIRARAAGAGFDPCNRYHGAP
ncbi:MAG: hypothetical protein ABSC06_21215 [Rhodopila sp.]